MIKKRCIYCNKTEEDGIKLSRSDIIPDALSNSKLLNKNVCRLEHNSHFSDDFESFIIEELEPLRHRFNVTTNKNNRAAQRNVKIKINNNLFNLKTDSINPISYIYNRNSIIGSNPEPHQSKVLLGPLDSFNNFPNLENNLEIVKLNEMYKTIETIHPEVFIHNKMFRLIAKIAFEWICYVYNINYKIDELDYLINFIESGGPIDNMDIEIIDGWSTINNYRDDLFKPGDHVIFSLKKKNYIHIFISFFNIIIYKLTIPNIFTNDASGCYYYIFPQNGSLEKYSRNDFDFIASENNTNYKVSNHKSSSYYIISEYLLNLAKPSETYTMNNILKQLEYVFFNLEINRISIIRFFIDNNLQALNSKDSILNLDNTSLYNWIIIWLLFTIGKKNISIHSDMDISSLLINEFNLDSENIREGDLDYQQLSTTILKEKSYKDYILKAFYIIESSYKK